MPETRKKVLNTVGPVKENVKLKSLSKKVYVSIQVKTGIFFELEGTEKKLFIIKGENLPKETKSGGSSGGGLVLLTGRQNRQNTSILRQGKVKYAHERRLTICFGKKESRRLTIFYSDGDRIHKDKPALVIGVVVGGTFLYLPEKKCPSRDPRRKCKHAGGPRGVGF